MKRNSSFVSHGSGSTGEIVAAGFMVLLPGVMELSEVFLWAFLGGAVCRVGIAVRGTVSVGRGNLNS